jgi:hypothetical protein
MIDVNRVVSRLMELVEDSYLAASLCRCCEDGITEMILGNHLRATESK